MSIGVNSPWRGLCICWTNTKKIYTSKNMKSHRSCFIASLKGDGGKWNELCLEFLSYFGGWWLIYHWFVTALSISQQQGKRQGIKIKKLFTIASAFSYLHPHTRKPWSSKHCTNTNQLMTPWAKPQQRLFLIHLLFVCAHKRQFCAISLFSQVQNGEKCMWAEKEAKDMECLDWVSHVPGNENGWMEKE